MLEKFFWRNCREIWAKKRTGQLDARRHHNGPADDPFVKVLRSLRRERSVVMHDASPAIESIRVPATFLSLRR